MDFRLGYITASGPKEARAIAAELLERQLIACANIFPAIESLYLWHDTVQQEKEAVLIMKTVAGNEAVVSEVVREMHSYECPCIVFVPLTGGDADFLKWVSDSCS